MSRLRVRSVDGELVEEPHDLRTLLHFRAQMARKVFAAHPASGEEDGALVLADARQHPRHGQAGVTLRVRRRGNGGENARAGDGAAAPRAVPSIS